MIKDVIQYKKDRMQGRGYVLRVIVFSDTHGNLSAASSIIEAHKFSDHFIFLGDGLEEINVLKTKYPDKNFYCVAGNCDKRTEPTTKVIELFNTKIFMTHGHLYNVRESHELLLRNAIREGATIILYGHTHCRYFKQQNGLYIINPGSASQPKDDLPPCYAFIDITPCGISCAHVDVD